MEKENKMPNCFQLISKTSKKPAGLSDVDDTMRKFFGAPKDEKHWYLEWYDTVGFALAMGNDWDQCRELILGDDEAGLGPVIDWLEEHFEVYAWATRGR